jgi:hypothetical protein
MRRFNHKKSFRKISMDHTNNCRLLVKLPAPRGGGGIARVVSRGENAALSPADPPARLLGSSEFLSGDDKISGLAARSEIFIPIFSERRLLCCSCSDL